jgi:hypothetical protein
MGRMSAGRYSRGNGVIGGACSGLDSGCTSALRVFARRARRMRNMGDMGWL